jgi:hypothetical protein
MINKNKHKNYTINKSNINDIIIIIIIIIMIMIIIVTVKMFYAHLGWYLWGAYVLRKFRGVPVLGDHHFIFSATDHKLSEYLRESRGEEGE